MPRLSDAENGKYGFFYATESGGSLFTQLPLVKGRGWNADRPRGHGSKKGWRQFFQPGTENPVPIGSSFALSNPATWLPQADAHDPWVLVNKKYRKM
jgi:hypothetical protein